MGLDGSPITFTSTANVGAAAKLAIVTQPSSSGQSGVPLETQPVIQLQDAFGNNVAQSGRAITAGVSGGSVTGGTASTDGTGKATFSSLAIVGSAGLSFAVTFSSGLLLPVTSEPVTLSAGNANKLVFLTTPPATVQAGVVWVQHPVIQLEDAGGNPLAIPDVNIVANISVGAGTLNGTKTVATDENGQAEFTDLEIDGKVGQRTVRFRIPRSGVVRDYRDRERGRRSGGQDQGQLGCESERKHRCPGGRASVGAGRGRIRQSGGR